jgi:hypothetical protein
LRTLWESKKINAARCHIFPNGAGPHTEAARAQLVEQLFVHEVHLPQIWRVRIFPDVVAMLYLFAHMGVAFDTEELAHRWSLLTRCGSSCPFMVQAVCFHTAWAQPKAASIRPPRMGPLTLPHIARQRVVRRGRV